MYYFLSMLTGFLITAMIVINGRLTGGYGVYFATVLIHISGLAVASAYSFLKREKIKPPAGLPIHFFMGGLIGVATTVFNNLSFGKISVSAILGLGLLGQSIASLVVDHFGLFQMPKRAFNSKKLIGIAFVMAGIGIIMVS